MPFSKINGGIQKITLLCITAFFNFFQDKMIDFKLPCPYEMNKQIENNHSHRKELGQNDTVTIHISWDTRNDSD